MFLYCFFFSLIYLFIWIKKTYYIYSHYHFWSYFKWLHFNVIIIWYCMSFELINKNIELYNSILFQTFKLFVLKCFERVIHNICVCFWYTYARFRRALTAEMCETFPSGGSMHASVKLEGIDGRAPQERVEHVA